MASGGTIAGEFDWTTPFNIRRKEPKCWWKWKSAAGSSGSGFAIGDREFRWRNISVSSNASTAANELRRETRGVGIGLSIVKHVAEGHGGRVLVESIVGEGSSFGLELPLDAGAPS